ncbi:MAG: hypothetical protein K1X53_03205 [Candidatus Sumerlaeaceae bacterium]|nr:hypothetical protein [Candidatus Sumerlaeaceae bacterium]
MMGRLQFTSASLFVGLVLGVFANRDAHCYPEFQKYSQSHSGRTVSCGMCHASPDGPEGTAPGQIGSLNKEGQQLLNEARAAFEPGKKVKSPILNDFGDKIIQTIGRKKVIELRRHPEEMSTALGNTSDLDNDGIPDSREFEDGTHPLHATSGSPWLLFKRNVANNIFHIVMMILATAAGLYGLHNLQLGLEHSQAGHQDIKDSDAGEGDGPSPPTGAPSTAQTITDAKERLLSRAAAQRARDGNVKAVPPVQ